MSSNQTLWSIKFICKKVKSNLTKISLIVKNGKFGKSKEYLKKNKKCEIKLSFKVMENKTKKIKQEFKTSSFLLQDTIIFLNNETITM